MKDKINYPVPGQRYQHYKGGYYEVLHLAKHTEDNTTLVIYKSLLYGTFYARPLDEWNKPHNCNPRFNKVFE